MGFVEAIKGIIVRDEDEYEDVIAEAEEEERGIGSAIKKSKIVSFNGGQASQRRGIVVLEPKCFEDSKEIANEIKQRMPVVFKVISMEPEEARRVVDFVTGTAYGVNGVVRRITAGIFIAAPANFDVFGECDDNDSNDNSELGMF